MKQIHLRLLFYQERNPDYNLVLPWQYLFPFSLFRRMFSPFVAVLGRMFKVNSKQANAPCVYPPIKHKRPEQVPHAGAVRAEHHLCGDQKLESELVRDIVCALRYPAALIKKMCWATFELATHTKSGSKSEKYLYYSSFYGTHILFKHA